MLEGKVESAKEEVSLTPRQMLPKFREAIQDELCRPLSGKATYAVMDGAHAPDLLGMLMNHGTALVENSDELQGQIEAAKASGKPVYCPLPLGHMAEERPLDCPYVIEIQPGNPLTEWLLNEGWGKGWGIYLICDHDAMLARQTLDYVSDPGPGLSTHDAFTNIAYDNEADGPMVHRLARQLRRFGRVQFESSGKLVYFRFYDPATLNTYLPTCTNSELKRFFGPVHTFYAEGFSEVESLNRMTRFHRYRLEQGSGGSLTLDHQRVDLLSREVEHLPRDPAHDLKNADPSIKVPPSGPLPLIRHAQELAFEEVEWGKFRERVVQDLIRVGEDEGKRKPNIENIRIFVAELFEKACSYNIKNQKNHFLYIMCAYYLGKQYDMAEPYSGILQSGKAEETIGKYLSLWYETYRTKS